MIQSMMYDDEVQYNLEVEIIHDPMHIDYVLKHVARHIKPYLDEYLVEINQNSPDNYFAKIIREQKAESEKYHQFYKKFVFIQEEKVDPLQFRKSLGKYCPIFHGAVNSKVDLLNKWKKDYYHCDCRELYQTIYNIGECARIYAQVFTEDKVKTMESWQDNGMQVMDDDTPERCYLTGVIGYGVMSTIAYHLNPRLFPGNYKQGVFALYFLSGGKPLETPSNISEFLMVKDLERSKTGIIESDHNYFFPYEVYAYYSFRIYKHLRQKLYERFNYKFPNQYRYVLTHNFYSFIVKCNYDKMQTLLGNDDYLKFAVWSLF